MALSIPNKHHPRRAIARLRLTKCEIWDPCHSPTFPQGTAVQSLAEGAMRRGKRLWSARSGHKDHPLEKSTENHRGLFENTKPIIGLNWLRRVGQPSRPRVLRNGKSSCVVCSLNGFLYRRSKQSLIRHSCCLNLVHGTSQSVASGLVESMMQSHGHIPD